MYRLELQVWCWVGDGDSSMIVKWRQEHVAIINGIGMAVTGAII